MGALVTTFENAILNHLFRNENIANVGDATGLRGSSADGSLYFSACSTWPGEAADQTSGEVSYTGYNSSPRASVARTTSAWNAASNGSISPVSAISFGKRTDGGAAVEICYLIVGASSSGAGTAIMWGAIGDASFGSRPFVADNTTNETLLIPSHGLAADDRIAFFAFEPAGAFPAGLVEGTVYFVRSTGLTTDALTVATTSGGAAVNITALGSGYAVKIKPISVTEGIEPMLAAGALVVLS